MKVRGECCRVAVPGSLSAVGALFEYARPHLCLTTFNNGSVGSIVTIADC